MVEARPSTFDAVSMTPRPRTLFIAMITFTSHNDSVYLFFQPDFAMDAINILLMCGLGMATVGLSMFFAVPRQHQPCTSPRESPNLLLVDISDESIAEIVSQVVSGVDNDQAAIMSRINRSIELQVQFATNQPSPGQVIQLNLNGIAGQCSQNAYVGYNGLNDSSNIDAIFYCNL